MDDDKFAFVEKILKDVDNVLAKTAVFGSFEIIPVDKNTQNKSPVVFMENCLGLESWCIKHVYMYCYSDLMDNYISKSKRRTMVSCVNAERLKRLLNVTLLLNPDLFTLWNKRRELVLKNLLCRTTEIKFTTLVLSRKPKCNDAFSYRRWLIELILEEETVESNFETLAHRELHVCHLASDKAPNNYHSWNHRMWFVNKMKHLDKPFNINLLYLEEYNYSIHFSCEHISDFSYFHYRQFCIKNIFSINIEEVWKIFVDGLHMNIRQSFISVITSNFPKEEPVVKNDLLKLYSDDSLMNWLVGHNCRSCKCSINNFIVSKKLDVLFYDLVVSNEMILVYKCHETLWCHRRFIIHEILLVLYDCFGLSRQNGVLFKDACKKCKENNLTEKQPKIVRYDTNNLYSSNLYKILITHEKKFIEEMQGNELNYAARHGTYLKHIEGMN